MQHPRPLCILKAGGTHPETARLAGDFEQAQAGIYRARGEYQATGQMAA